MLRVISTVLLMMGLGAASVAAATQPIDIGKSVPSLKHESTQGLVAKTKDPSGLVRSAAARELANRKISEAVGALKALLSDPLHYVQIAAAEALLDLGDASGTRILQAEAADKSSPQAFGAARSLLKHGDPTGAGLVKSKLSSPVSLERGLAIEALRFSKDQEQALAALKKGLSDTDKSVRHAAIFWTADLATPQSIAFLASTLSSFSDATDRAFVMQAVARTGLWDAIPILLTGLDDSEYLVRVNAATYLNLLTRQEKPVFVRDPAKAKEMAQQWRQWWEANKAKYPAGSKSSAPFLKRKNDYHP